MAVVTPLSLKSILVPSKSIEIEYPGLNGFKVNVVFLSRETLVSIRKKSTKTSFKNRQATEEMDDKLFLQLYKQPQLHCLITTCVFGLLKNLYNFYHILWSLRH